MKTRNKKLKKIYPAILIFFVLTIIGCNSGKLNQLQNKVSDLEAELKNAKYDLRRTKYSLEETEDKLESTNELLEDTQNDLSRAKSKIWDIEIYSSTLDFELQDLSSKINFFSSFDCQDNIFSIKSQLSDVESAFQSLKSAL